ncbi:MAG: ABC transporter permease [Candidatus Latescibacteria bacterium]|nr:ABC transporter permease [Candidatus Latescibacterota bacterium]
MIILAEIRKRLLIMWSYRLNTFFELVVFGAIFAALGFFVGQGRYEPDRLAAMLVGYTLWFYALIALTDMSLALSEESQTGTLEQLYMSPAPMEWLACGRVAAIFVRTTLLVCLLVPALSLALDIHLALRWSALPIFALTLVGLSGFGFALSGLTLLYKQTGAVAQLLQNLLLLGNGTILPIDRFPPLLADIARQLPTSRGIILLRRLLLEDESLAALWRDHSLIWLALQSMLFLLVGWTLFKWCEKRALQRGILGMY